MADLKERVEKFLNIDAVEMLHIQGVRDAMGIIKDLYAELQAEKKYKEALESIGNDRIWQPIEWQNIAKQALTNTKLTNNKG